MRRPEELLLAAALGRARLGRGCRVWAGGKGTAGARHTAVPSWGPHSPVGVTDVTPGDPHGMLTAGMGVSGQQQGPEEASDIRAGFPEAVIHKLRSEGCVEVSPEGGRKKEYCGRVRNYPTCSGCLNENYNQPWTTR